jgi:hypothetical protein
VHSTTHAAIIDQISGVSDCADPPRLCNLLFCITRVQCVVMALRLQDVGPLAQFSRLTSVRRLALASSVGG